VPGGDAQPKREDSTVAGIMQARWGVRPPLAVPRLAEPGWSYEEPVPAACPRCGKPLHCLRKPYESAGKQYRYVALVCPDCPAAFTLPDLGFKAYQDMMRSARKPRAKRVPRPVQPGQGGQPKSPQTDGVAGRPKVGLQTITKHRADAYLRELLSRARPRARGLPEAAGGPGRSAVWQDRRLHWVKLGNPGETLPEPQPGVELRVLIPDHATFDQVRQDLAKRGVPARAIRYWLESEVVLSVTLDGRLGPLAACSALSTMAHTVSEWSATRVGAAAAAARDAFDLIWQDHAEDEPTVAEYVAAGDHLPGAWLPYLPFPALNPAQAEAAPHVADGTGHVLVVAPTGAGKTVIGMMAALRAVLTERRKAAWLVPQRSLTDELDRELETWRRAGMRVERLSGEFAIDAQRVRDADLWVATTEKFESICRTGSVREALSDVGCLVVDEIHLLGDLVRGPVLEALLARVRGADSPVRIVGLSATVANADQIADWLGARLVRIKWRPSRLTWQLPVIAASSDRTAAESARTRVATAITRMINQDQGSVLVFCGSKRGVRATAMAIATDRGADTRSVDLDDLDRVQEVCAAEGVGLHYKDWPHKRQAEQEFRDRRLDVLVATTTVAAGVNLPARAVIVRDTTVGLNEMSVALVQQMFGRAGRISAGENDGWAFLIVDENERPIWQERLVAGYSVISKIAESLPDHVLAEMIQGRISTLGEAESWWVQTLAHHQGHQDTALLHEALDLLVQGGYIVQSSQKAGDADIVATDLGVLTARLMVSTQVGQAVRAALLDAPLPAGPDAAEQMLISALSALVPKLAEAPVPDEQRSAVARLLQAGGDLARLGSSRAFTRKGLASQAPYVPGDLARATLLTAARSPHAFATPARKVADIPYASMYPILEEAPHYLQWIGAQGFLGTIPPWCAIVAADLARRVRWRRCAPRRGAGRLLWMFEQMATAIHADTVVPAMWQAASARGLVSPDWPPGARPAQCQLDDSAYTTLLRDRATGSMLEDRRDHVLVSSTPGAAIATWAGRRFAHQLAREQTWQATFPDADEDDADDGCGAALFTRRGDHLATGWLANYQHIQ
jgi:helicase